MECALWKFAKKAQEGYRSLTPLRSSPYQHFQRMLAMT